MLNGWTTFEKAWVLSFTLIGIGVAVLSDGTWFSLDKGTLLTWLGLISTITGMVCNVLCAKGKVANYFFGIINVITYGYVAYSYGLYGEASLNWGFYFIANILGFYLWSKNAKKQEDIILGEDVPVKRLSAKGWLLVVAIFIVGAIVYAYILNQFNAQQVRIDSMAVVLSVIAQTLLILRYSANWYLWIVVNTLSIVLWIVTLVQSGGNDYIMLVMWSAYLVNAIYGCYNWVKLNKLENKEGIQNGN